MKHNSWKTDCSYYLYIKIFRAVSSRIGSNIFHCEIKKLFQQTSSLREYSLYIFFSRMYDGVLTLEILQELDIGAVHLICQTIGLYSIVT